MTSTTILNQREAIAREKGLELAQELAPLDESLRLVADEPFPSKEYVLAEVARVAVKVCLEQREHIVDLAQRIEELEASTPEGVAEKK